MLLFYRSIGHDISKLHNESKYGKSFYKNLSQDLQTVLPDVKSFSITNLKYMKYFYEMYHASNRQQAVDDFENTNYMDYLYFEMKCDENQNITSIFVDWERIDYFRNN